MIRIANACILSPTMQNYSMPVWTNFIYPILSSPATTTLVAIIASVVAFGIYFLRKRDQKKDAANIVLLELQNAEANLKEANKTYQEAKTNNPQAIVFPEKLRLMKSESWTKYRYMFVRDFEPVQWQEISEFYENCKYFDDAVEHKDETFHLNETEIRAAIHRNTAEYAKEYIDNITPNPDDNATIADLNRSLGEETQQKRDAVVQATIDYAEVYNPDKSFRDAAYYFNLLPMNITNSATGERLKKLAGLRKKRMTRK